MECQIVQVRQGSDDWDALRRCRITASRLGDVMAGRQTKRYTEYRKQLVLEMNGVEFENKDEPWFAHGKALEPRALAAYEWRYNQKLLHDIMLIHHKYDWLSASPDFMTTDFSEGGEIKCRKMYQTYSDVVSKIEHMESQKKHSVPTEHRFQVQGAMWLTGLDSWWYVNYYENEKSGTRKLHRVLVQRDEDLIARMERRCIEFMIEVRELSGE